MATGILVSYSGFPYTPSSFFPDNGLANLAGALKEGGHGIRILDFSTLETFDAFMPRELKEEFGTLLPYFFQPPKDPEIVAKFRQAEGHLDRQKGSIVADISRRILAEVDKAGADWVGFKLYLGDGLEGSIDIANFLREKRPSLKIFAGGPLVDLFKGFIYRRTPVFDALIYAEGENVILPLMEYVEGKRELATVPNTIYRDEAGDIRVGPLERLDDLDGLPVPSYDRDVYPALYTGGKLKIVTFDESRGCPFKCAFCIHAEKSGLKLRQKSVERMIAELKQLMQVCDTRVFRFAGSATPYQTLAKLGERLLEEKLDIMYSIYGTAHHLMQESLPLLRKSGLWAIFYGVESGDERILQDSMGKRNNHPEKMKELLRATMDADIFTVASIIYPAPHEDEESSRHTLEFLQEVFRGRSNCSVPVTFSGLFPTTDWMADHEKYGFDMGAFDECMMQLMNYKIKSLLPYWLWPGLPYTLNGKAGGQLQAEASWMIQELEKDGITTMLLDDSAMIGSLAGYDLKQYRKEVAAAFYTGNVDYASDLLDRVNQAASPSVAS